MTAVMLATQGLTKAFGGLVAVNDLDIVVESGVIHAIIGPNGSGKTTFFNLLSGMTAPNAGRIEFCGRRIEGELPHRRARLGIRRTFQNIRLFDDLSVLENVLLGQHTCAHAGLMSLVGRWTGEEKRLRGAALSLLDRLGIAEVADRRARDLAYGPRRLVEIARAMASAPKLLLLDEPTAGMNPRETEEVARVVSEIRAGGVTVLLIEHHMDLVAALAERITVLNFGVKIAEGSPAEVLHTAAVVDAYLGKAEAP
ncbi:MAG TPA: ABC transporter ATP-binding protein [Stellaceae bacterium]|nr:ABC transporter ATP-binding protein [Stellaceae bacterium]